MIIDLDEYEKELSKQKHKSKEKAEQGNFLKITQNLQLIVKFKFPVVAEEILNTF